LESLFLILKRRMKEVLIGCSLIVQLQNICLKVALNSETSGACTRLSNSEVIDYRGAVTEQAVLVF
jgi:hypothetical protein